MSANVSWLQLDTASRQISVSWFQFDTMGAVAVVDNGWMGGPKGRKKHHKYPEYRQTAEQVKAQRIELGIIEPDEDPEPIPPAVKKIIRQVAKAQVARPYLPDSTALAELEQKLRQQQLASRESYARLLARQRDEMRSRDIAYQALLKRMRDDDEESAHLLLM